MQIKEKIMNELKSAQKRLKLFIENGYKIKDELKEILRERNKKFLKTFFKSN
jgi:sRNA-binding regulator protein Hfq